MREKTEAKKTQKEIEPILKIFRPDAYLLVQVGKNSGFETYKLDSKKTQLIEQLLSLESNCNVILKSITVISSKPLGGLS